MGLDFSHGEGHWSYGGFMRFRNRIVQSLGYDNLSEMYNDGSYTKMSELPIYPLLNHSDCDGVLTVEEMKQIIPPLKLIVDMWEINVPDDYDVPRARKFIEGMEYAIEDDEELEFI